MRKLVLALTAVAATAALPASAGAQDPVQTDMPNMCKYLANTACQYLPPTSVEDVCGILEATTVFGCEITAQSRASAEPDIPGGIPADECELRKKLGITSPMPCPWPPDETSAQ